jgi:hypothetical protein
MYLIFLTFSRLFQVEGYYHLDIAGYTKLHPRNEDLANEYDLGCVLVQAP